jgi:PAS domain S-box-containing protein
MMNQTRKRETSIIRYIVGVVTPLIVAGVLHSTWPFFQTSPVSPFLFAVTISAWYGGLGPGLLALLISYLLADYLFIPPYFSLGPPSMVEAAYLVNFTLVGSAITILSELMLRARRLAEENLDASKRSEGMYRSLAAPTSAAVWNTDADGNMLSEIPDWSRITGQSFAAAKGSGWLLALHPDDVEEFKRARANADGARKSFEIESRIRQENGGYLHYLLRGVPIWEGDGTTIGAWINSATEVTERKLAEERFRLVVEASPSAIVMVNDQGRITFLNTQTEQLFGYPRSELLEQPVEILVPERYRHAHPGHRAGFFRSPSTRSMGAGRDLFGRRKDGSEFPVEIGLNPIQAEQGAMVLGTIVDITERKQAEETVRRSQQQLAGVIGSAMDAIITVDHEQRIILFNGAAERMFLFPAEDAIGQALDRFIPERFRHVHKGHIQAFASTHVTRRSMGTLGALYGLRADGEEFPLEASISQIESDGQKLFTVILRDITERKRADEALKEQTRILDLAPVLIRDISGRIVFWNTGAELMYGWTSAEALEKISHNLMKTEFPRPMEEIKARLLSRGYWEGELVHIRKNGQRLVVASHWVLHKDEEGKPKAVLEVNNDITERKEAEKEVRRLNEELEQRVANRTAELQTANKGLEAFSYSVSHDLRAPLRHIDGFSQALLEDYSDKLDSTGKTYLQEVRSASQEMAQLIDDMLQLARVTRTEMRREVVNLSSAARAVMSELTHREPDRQVAVNIEDGLTTHGDKRLLKIILTNLLGNAWKFTSREERAEISFGRHQQNGESSYFISDNGAGFDMAYLGKLFGAFQRLHTAGEFEGTGVGLATVQRIVHRHGGRVWAEGAVSKGATFYFTLPNSQETGDG